MAYDGLGPDELQHRLGVPHLLCLRKVTSTLDLIHELAQDAAPTGTLVLADEQVAGRGRQGRSWHSPPGVGVWIGLLRRPERKPETGVFALRVGLVLVDALATLGITARIKWPNDVVVRGRKLAGVLCETRWLGERLRWMAVGVGINVHHPLPDEVTHTAIALAELVPTVSRVAVLEALAPRLVALSDEPTLSDGELAAYRQHDALMGHELVEPVRGHAKGIDHDGALLVQTPHGVERVAGGHIVAA